MQQRKTIWIVTALIAFAVNGLAMANGPQVGQPTPPFELTASDGKLHKLSDYQGKIVVLHFQSCHCPWDVAYQPFLNALAKKFTTIHANDKGTKRVVFLAINANWSESVHQIKRYVAQAGIPYPVLKDTGNRVADAYAAMTTPHIFVIHNDQEQTLAYKGGIERPPLSPPHCGESSQQYLEPVLRALLDGTTPHISETQNIGCSIKRENGSNFGG